MTAQSNEVISGRKVFDVKKKDGIDCDLPILSLEFYSDLIFPINILQFFQGGHLNQIHFSHFFTFFKFIIFQGGPCLNLPCTLLF